MDAHRVYLTITGLDGPTGRLSRADIGINVRRTLDFPTAGAFFGGLPLHGPTQWLEPAPMMSPVPQHIQDRMFTPGQTMPGQTTLGEI